MKKKRGLFSSVALLGGVIAVMALPQSEKRPMQSAIFDWNDLAIKPTKVGARRDFFQAPTATLDELECHATTINPGEAPHPPHQHPDEEMVIVKEGTIKVTVAGQTRRIGPGSMAFMSSNQMHGILNDGSTPATYVIIRWKSPAVSKEKP